MHRAKIYRVTRSMDFLAGHHLCLVLLEPREEFIGAFAFDFHLFVIYTNTSVNLIV